MSALHEAPDSRSRILRVGTHVFVGVLLVVIAGSSIADGDPEWLVLGLCGAVGAAYVAGWAHAITSNAVRVYVWGATLSALWVALVVVTPDGVWLGFGLFFLAVHVLPLRAALPVVVALTAIAVIGFAWHQGHWNVGGVLGPILGGTVAVGTVLGLRVSNEQSQRRGVMDERDRLAREIHDSLAQGLNSIHLLLGAAEVHLSADPAEARRLVGQAREAAADHLEEARRFVRALAPADLTQRSLEEALARLTSRVDCPPVTMMVEGEPTTLSGDANVALFRIAQEAIANAVRHAEASKIAVTLTYMNDQVVLDIVDDGIGGADSVDGFGMASMRQRASQLGGDLVIESKPGGGTAVAASLPVSSP